MIEIGDACSAEESPATLFVFIGVPAINRQSLDQQLSYKI
jgi:hypothetical protein